MIDDDDDGFLFDADEEAVGDGWRPNCLVVAEPCAKPEDLNTLEEQYRREGRCPVMFVEQEYEDGPYVLGNAAQFGAAMGLAPGSLPTLEQAEAFMGEQWAR